MVRNLFSPNFDSAITFKEINDIESNSGTGHIWQFICDSPDEIADKIISLLWNIGSPDDTIEGFLAFTRDFLDISSFDSESSVKDNLLGLVGEYLLTCFRVSHKSIINGDYDDPYTFNRISKVNIKGIDLLENFKDCRLIIWESKSARKDTPLVDKIDKALRQASTRYGKSIKSRLYTIATKDERFKAIYENLQNDDEIWIMSSVTGYFPGEEIIHTEKRNSLRKKLLRNLKFKKIQGCLFQIKDLDLIINKIYSFYQKLNMSSDKHLLKSQFKYTDFI